MRNLGAHEDYQVDSQQLAKSLRLLAGSFPRPKEEYAGPYGVVGYGDIL